MLRGSEMNKNAIRQALAAVWMLQLLSACGGGRDEAVCGLSIEYQGQTYHQVHIEPAPSLGESLGEATLPRCNDTNRESPGPTSIVTVRRVAGVSPAVAIAWQDNILLAPGTNALPAPSPTH
jgi:hypothetical protein